MELIEYWPQFLRDLFEFDQVGTALQPEFTQAVQDVQSAPEDFFLESLSVYGCTRWEAILGIVPASGDTLEDRRDRILIKYLNHLPYTWRTLLSYLQSIDPQATATLEDYLIQIDIALGGDALRAELSETLSQMIPVNMVWILRAMLRQKLIQPALAYGAGMAAGMITHRHQPAERS